MIITRQNALTYAIATAGTCTLALWLMPRATACNVPASPPLTQATQHKVDVVFAVDTTGSMGGLIDGAKRTVWSIASHVREIEPNADVRIGLVAYRDVGDDYVTKDFALTTDMDAVFAELSSYAAAGGGDTPENVDAALYDAVHKMQWRQDSKKMIFLVGDAPPSSRGDVPRFDVTARDAAKKRIVVNAIRCGEAPDTMQAWQRIAALGRGEFSTIAQTGGVQQMATPYDDKLAELSRTVDHATVIYGDSSAHEAYAGAMAAASEAPTVTKADRAAYFAASPSGKMGRASADITERVAGGSVNLATLDRAKLPAEMRDKSAQELKRDIDARAKARQAAQAEIEKLAKQRADYLHTHASKDGEGFDAKVKATLERQLK
jgi:hypothetical protein